MSCKVNLVAASSMLIGPQSYEHTFRDIQQSLQSSDEKNVIICASTAECDSVCAVRILQVSFVGKVKESVHLRPSKADVAASSSLACKSPPDFCHSTAALVDEQWHPLLDIPG